MIYLNHICLREESLIELCTFPGMNVHNIMLEMGNQKEKSFYIDTIGNLDLLAVNCFRIFKIDEMIQIINNLKGEFDFFLFIDTISFIVDDDIKKYKEFFDLLWEVIFFNKATIIVSNHYKILRDGKGNLTYKPRLGGKWENNLSYRILMEWKASNISFKVKDYLWEDNRI